MSIVLKRNDEVPNLTVLEVTLGLHVFKTKPLGGEANTLDQFVDTFSVT